MRSIPVPLTILRALADETLRRLKLAGEIEHPGESGRAREQILMAFIQQLIPSSFGVSTGFVVDALGGKSKQIDVVVYRTDFAPVFQIGGVKHFLIESVVAVLEVKAAIDSHADLTRALDNIASVKALDRSNRGRNKLLSDRVRTELSVDRDVHAFQVFGVIVTEKSLVKDFEQDLVAWLSTRPRREWPNLYVDVHRLAAYYGYLEPTPDNPQHYVAGAEAMRAERLFISEPDVKNEAPLVFFGYQLIDWFRIVPTIDIGPVDYFPIRGQRYRGWSLPATDSAEPEE
jgi:hypothetical protein